MFEDQSVDPSLCLFFKQYETREVEFESRTIQKYDLQIEGLQHDIEHLQKQVRWRDGKGEVWLRMVVLD